MLFAMLAEPPAAAAAVRWVEQPTAQELSLSRAKYSETDRVEAHLAMTCYVQADGGLAACDGDPALTRLSRRYHLDRAVYTAATVTVRADLPKLYDDPPKELRAPDPTDLRALGGTGLVSILCRVTEDGALTDCEPAARPLTPSQPADLALAFKAAALYRYKPAALRGRPVSSYTVLHVGLGGVVRHVTRPAWLRKPSGAELSRVFPAAAFRQQISGSVMLTCIVTAEGAVSGCRAHNETPEGYGFAAAALQLTPLFQMKPLSIDGQPVGGSDVTIPIQFVNQGGGPGGGGITQTVGMMTWAPLLAAPVASQVQAVFPPEAAAKHVFGKVVVLCSVQPSGALTRCETQLNSAPSGGFETAAKRLTPLFKVDVGPTSQAALETLRLSLTFDFSARTLESAPDRFLRGVDWVRSLDPKAAIAAYRSQAVAAGVLSGGATVECRLDAKGQLTECGAISETAPNLGFGAAAVAVASLMQANLWTRDGEPAIGAKVRLPLKFIYSRDSSPAADPAAAGK